MATKEEIAAAIQEAKDAKDRDAAGREYNKRTSVEPSKDPAMMCAARRVMPKAA